MSLFIRPAMLIALGITAACASTATHGNVAPQGGGAGESRWTGSFKTMGGTSATMTSNTNSQGSAFGNVTIVTLDSAPPSSRVDLAVTAPSMTGEQLAWAVFTGPCGSPTPPIVGVNEFPTLEMASGGGHIGTTLRFRLKPGTDYHVNVYTSGRVTDVSNVLMCAALSSGR